MQIGSALCWGSLVVLAAALVLPFLGAHVSSLLVAVTAAAFVGAGIVIRETGRRSAANAEADLRAIDAGAGHLGRT